MSIYLKSLVKWNDASKFEDKCLIPEFKFIPAEYDHNEILKRNWVNPYICIKHDDKKCRKSAKYENWDIFILDKTAINFWLYLLYCILYCPINRSSVLTSVVYTFHCTFIFQLLSKVNICFITTSNLFKFAWMSSFFSKVKWVSLYLYTCIYKVVISVCLFGILIITHEHLERVASNLYWGT